jgi:hypothetical protein
LAEKTSIQGHYKGRAIPVHVAPSLIPLSLPVPPVKIMISGYGMFSTLAVCFQVKTVVADGLAGPQIAPEQTYLLERKTHVPALHSVNVT